MSLRFIHLFFVVDLCHCDDNLFIFFTWGGGAAHLFNHQLKRVAILCVRPFWLLGDRLWSSWFKLPFLTWDVEEIAGLRNEIREQCDRKYFCALVVLGSFGFLFVKKCLKSILINILTCSNSMWIRSKRPEMFIYEHICTQSEHWTSSLKLGRWVHMTYVGYK